MQARLTLSKDECLNLLQNWYINIYQIPVEVNPVFPLLSNGNQPTVFFRMNESMLNEQDFLVVLNRTLERAGFMIMQSITHVNMEKETEFQGISIVIQKVTDINLDILPEWLHERIQGLEFADRIRTFQMHK